MRSAEYNRKKFFKTLGVATAGTALFNLLPFSSAQAGSNIFTNTESGDDYLFSDGLTYMNTGTLGPCRRQTIEESLNIWKQLESFPVKFYGKSGAEDLAEKTRTIAAGFLGCDLSEMLITNSTTSGTSIGS